MAQNLTLQNFKILPLGRGVQIAVSKEHTFGTDAVLLAHFAAPKPQDIAADLCTGCGIIPLLWQRDRKTAYTAGIDISENAVALANQSLTLNCLAPEKLRFFKADLKNPFQALKKSSFSLVTCNPPYFAKGSGPQSSQPASQTARHEISCDLNSVIQTAAALLKFGGRFVLCQRPERLSEIFSLMTANRLEPKRLQLVCKTQGKAPWLVLVEGRMGGKPGLKILPDLYLYKSSNRQTEQLQEIYAPFFQSGGALEEP